ncbi:MAG: DapH/DapD/GlmU-related protein [Candidatus Eisenbacteria bacterium]
MPDPYDVLVPRETVNDDIVTLVRWHAASGEAVRAGATLFEIETSKTVYTIEAERDGYLEIVCAAGEEIAVGERAGRLHEAPLERAAGTVASRGHGVVTAGTQVISRKARQLIESNGLDPARFAHLSIVREADVLQAIEAKPGSALAGNGSVAPGPVEPEGSRSFLKDMTVASSERGKNILWLAANYLFRNYLLGLLVRIAPRGVILPLHRLRGVKIGKGCYIDPSAIVETAYPENITLGDDVRIAAGAIIMTHIKAPHHLRESGLVPSVLKEVVLEDHCFIGVNSVVMPGVRVGKASVVVSGAVVLGDVPPYCMVAGNPAQVVKRFVRPAGK